MLPPVQHRKPKVNQKQSLPKALLQLLRLLPARPRQLLKKSKLPMAHSKTTNKPVKKRLTPEQRAQRLQRAFFAVMAFILIFSWIISLVAH